MTDSGNIFHIRPKILKDLIQNFNCHRNRIHILRSLYNCNRKKIKINESWNQLYFIISSKILLKRSTNKNLSIKNQKQHIYKV